MLNPKLRILVANICQYMYFMNNDYNIFHYQFTLFCPVESVFCVHFPDVWQVQ